MQADLMKLIAYGKVMDDDTKTLKDFSIKDADQIVVMISKVIYYSLFVSNEYYQPKPMAKPKTEDQKKEEEDAAKKQQTQS